MSDATDETVDLGELEPYTGPEETDEERAERVAAATEKRLTVAEKRALALQLRLAGMNYRDIADEVGWKNASSAKRAVDEEIARIPRENARQLKAMQLETLNETKLGIFAAVRVGDLQAIDRLLKVMHHEAMLEGLYDLPDTSANVDVKTAFSALMNRARKDAKELDAGDS